MVKANDWTDVLFEQTDDNTLIVPANDSAVGDDSDFWSNMSNIKADDIIEAAIQKKKQRDLAKAKAKNSQLAGANLFDSPLASKASIDNKSKNNDLSNKSPKKAGFKKPIEKKPFVYQHERDPIILRRRQKQIDYGKNTLGYQNYVESIPKPKRTREHPKTPRKGVKYSRRSWDMQIKLWRIKLHHFDSKTEPQEGIGAITATSMDIDIPADDVSEVFDSAFSEALSETIPSSEQD